MIYVVLGTLFLDWLLLARLHVPLALASMASIVFLFVLAVVERRWPYRPEYRKGVQGTWVDIGFLAWTEVGMNIILGLVITHALVPLVMHVRSTWGLAPTWGISAWPIYVQVVIGWLLLTFVDYWAHRLAHGVLWPIHKLHHMTPQLGVLKFSLSHPLEILLVVQLRLFPMLLLGMAGAAIEHVVFLQVAFSIPVHANVRFTRFPAGLFTSIHEHEIHHGTDPREELSNFGVLTTLWDHVFRTYRTPRAEWRPVGIHSELLRTERDYLRYALRYVLSPWRQADAVEPNAETETEREPRSTRSPELG